jgi:hypothetical protein
MKSPRPSTNSSSSPSFALISVLALVSLAALTATAFLASARLERQATMPLTQTTMLDMALDCGSVAAMRLLEYGAGEQFNHVVTYWRGTNTNDWTNELGYLLIGALEDGNIGSDPLQLKYYFCFSSAELTNLGTNLVEYTNRANANDQGRFNRQIGLVLNTAQRGINFAAGQSTNIPLLGDTPANRFTSPPVGWVYINQDVRVKPGQTNTTNVPVTRFAFYVQDLSSMIDADRMGGFTNGTPFRQSTALPTNYMQGTNPAEISLTNLTGTALTDAATAANFTSTNNRVKYLSPGMLVLPGGGGLNTSDLRYVTTSLRHWTNAYERIPFGLGYSNCGTTSAGKKKFNFTTGATIDAIAAHITSNLSTSFLERAGGLTTNQFDYAKCLAANIVDYIDTDSTPTYGSSGTTKYCGIELAPVVTCAALANARATATYKPPLVSSTLSPPPTYSVTEQLTATLSLQFWNPYDKATPAATVPLEFRTCPPGTESSDGLAFIVAGDNATPVSGNGFYKHFETLFPSFQSTTINIPAIPPNSYALVEVASANTFTWVNPCGARISASQYQGMQVSKKLWKPTYVSNNETTREVKYTKGNSSYSSDPSSWKLNNFYFDSDGKPSLNAAWRGYLKIGNNGTLCTLTNLYMNSGSVDDDNANRTCWYPNLRLFAGTIGTGTLSDSTNCVGTGDPRISYFARPTNDQPLYNHSSWSRSGNTAAGLSWGGRAIVRASVGSDAVKTTRITEKSSVFRDASLATDPTTWLDSGHADNPLGANNDLGATANADSPSQPTTYASAANLFSKIPSSQWKTNQAPCHIANSPLTNICELGNIFDPIMWTRESQDIIGLKDSSNKPSVQHGGGNTLRIGRAEHRRFAWTNLSSQDPSIPNMQMSAAALLDLFCLSNQFDEGGKINLNTAPAPVLRALAGGIYLRSDPALLTGGTNFSIPPAMAEAFAQGVMRFRAQYPFYSPSQLAFINTSTDWSKGSTGVASIWPTNAVFGNTNSIYLANAPGNTFGTAASIGITEWNDKAAEEWFAKIFSLSTVYSRNFRVYVIAQKATTNSSGAFIGVGPVARKYYNLLLREAGDNENDEPGADAVITSQSSY